MVLYSGRTVQPCRPHEFWNWSTAVMNPTLPPSTGAAPTAFAAPNAVPGAADRLDRRALRMLHHLAHDLAARSPDQHVSNTLSECSWRWTTPPLTWWR
jgi:hypothetical protein